jgi:GNAT superfamily N-acetyltransferase
MMSVEARARIRAMLEENRGWCAYALADLEPGMDQHCRWIAGENAVALIYRGFDPPTLFGHGDPNELKSLFEQAPPGRYGFTLLGSHRALLDPRLEVEYETEMWRMVHQGEAPKEHHPPNVSRLSPDQLEAVEHLFGDHPDRPDAFHPRQIEGGPFYGYWDGAHLISVAGVHIVSKWADVAALGNVFTTPERRGEGYGTLVSAAVLRDLLRSGIGTIVLNVAMTNQAALRSYTKLDFMPFCGYMEGIATLLPPP